MSLDFCPFTHIGKLRRISNIEFDDKIMQQLNDYKILLMLLQTLKLIPHILIYNSDIYINENAGSKVTL